MNFNIGGSSSFVNSSSSSSSSSESSEIDEWLKHDNAAREIEEQIAVNLLAKNNFLIHQLTQQSDHGNHRGSIHGHAVIHRDRENAHSNLYNDYFSNNPVYGEREFHRRFRMSRGLFLRIVDAVTQHDNYFHQRRIATGRMGLSTLQKVTAAIRILAYGVPADATDEYIKIGESTAIECMKKFCRAIVEVFSEWYLRSPTSEDIARLLSIGQQRGFPGMLGSLDCMHWKWKNCPTAWAGQFAGRSGSPTIILEAVADYDLWIGMPILVCPAATMILTF